MKLCVLGVLIGCGGGSDGDPLDDTTCGVDLVLSGGVTATVGIDEAACASQIGSPSFGGIDVYFLPLDDAPRVDLAIDDVTPGMLGTFATELTIDPAGTQHRASCMTTLTEHTEVGPGVGELDDTAYRVRGSVACAVQAMSASAPPSNRR